MLLKKALSDQMTNISCVLSLATYGRYEGIARHIGNLAQAALRCTKTASACASTSRRNSKKSCRGRVSDFFNSIDPYLPFDIGLILSSPASLPDCPGRYRRDLAKETLRPKAWISAHALLMLSSASLTGGALGMTNFFAELNRCHIYSGGT